MTQPPYDPSRDRQLLNQLLLELSGIIRAFNDHGALVRGSIQTLARRCGKPRCRCVRGALHRSLVFVDRQGEKPTIRKVTAADGRRLRPLTTEYRKMRGLRARLARLHREMLLACDRLTRFRLSGDKRLHRSP